MKKLNQLQRVRCLLLLGVLALLVPGFGGCASITRGTTEAFVVESDPLGANVELSNGLTCRTPCSLTMKRKDAFTVKVSKDGYEPVEAAVQSQVSGAGGAAMAGNIIFGGLIGAAVDVGTGAMNELKPNPLRVDLVGIKDIAPAVAAITATRPSRYASPQPPEPREAAAPEIGAFGLRKVREPRVTPLLVSE